MMLFFLLISKIIRNQMLSSINNNLVELSITPNIYNTTYGCDDRFEIKKKDIDPIIVESISINMKKKEILNILISDIVSTNTKLKLVKKYEILIPSNISQINFFTGGLMKDFDF